VPRARDVGVVFGELEPGPVNAITDVEGTRVGHATIVDGEAVRTGVTVVLPGRLPVFAGAHRLNGNGELTRLEWVRESGLLTTPVGLTNTFSVGVVRDALVAYQHERGAGEWHLPVVGETYDGRLNDIEGMHVRRDHVFGAIAAATVGAVEEGAVGGGTGMICHGFKAASEPRRAGWATTSSACSCRRTTGGGRGCGSTASPSARTSRSRLRARTRRPGRSSSSWRPRRPCCRTSASGSRSGRRSESDGWAARARTRAAT
jgi:hypothetical protein